MRDPEPTIETMTISDVKSKLSSLVKEVSRNDARVVVEKRGRPVAAIISIEDLRRFALLEREREERFAVIDRMREAFKDVPPEEIEREAARSVAEARARRRRTPEAATPLGESEPRNQTLTLNLEISDVKSRLSELVSAASRNGARVLIAKRDVPIAALVSTDDLERLERLDAEWEETTRALERISEAFADVPVEELEARIDEIIAEGRARDLVARRSA